MKLLKILFLIAVGQLGYTHVMTTVDQVSHFTGDSVSSEQLPDSNRVHEDSLNKIVPYLDEVKADSHWELMVVYMLLIILTTFLSEDLACIGAGLMVANGMIEFWPAAIGAVMGIYIGDFTLYFMGRIVGMRIFDMAPFKWMLKKESVFSAEAWFQKKGPIILVLSRFIPGSRFPVYLSAGLLETGFWTFLTYFGVTVLVWTPLFVWISVFAGYEVLAFYEAYENYALWTLLGIAGAILILLRYLIPALQEKFKV